ncbi:MAG: hypothetical protein AB7V50_08015 [Vampirovibrionia bacterium]
MIQQMCVSDVGTKSSSNYGKLQNLLLNLPFWVKQMLYIELRSDLRQYTNLEALDRKDKDDLVQSYVLTPTALGRLYIQRRSTNFTPPQNIDPKHRSLLKSLGLKKTILDICNENKWSLIQCCRIIVECIENGLVEPVNNNSISNIIYYISGRIRLGEYLLRMNKLSLDQVDRALYRQKEITQQLGEKTKIGELLVNLGYINYADKEEILKLKENSDNVCDLSDETTELKARLKEMQMKLESLQFENEGYKQDLEDYQQELINQSMTIAKLELNIPAKSKQTQDRKINFSSFFNIFSLNFQPKNV